MPANLNGGAQSTIMLADFSQIAVAQDLNPQVTVLSELYADYDQQAIRVVARYDMQPLNPAAVVLLKSVTA
jgi:HK97 family phage major capsid protein